MGGEGRVKGRAKARVKGSRVKANRLRGIIKACTWFPPVNAHVMYWSTALLSQGSGRR